MGCDLADGGKELGPRTLARLLDALAQASANDVFVFGASFNSDVYPSQTVSMARQMTAVVEVAGFEAIVPDEHLGWGSDAEIAACVHVLRELAKQDEYVYVTLHSSRGHLPRCFLILKTLLKKHKNVIWGTSPVGEELTRGELRRELIARLLFRLHVRTTPRWFSGFRACLRALEEDIREYEKLKNEQPGIFGPTLPRE